MIATIGVALALAAPVSAHVDDETLPPNADEIFIPQNLPLIHVVRFTRGDYRLLEDRLSKGDTHHLGTMTLPLTTAAVAAGTHDARSTGRVLWEMSRKATFEERSAYLQELDRQYRRALAELEAAAQPSPDAADAAATPTDQAGDQAGDPSKDQSEDQAALAALIALIALWQSNPMDGAGS